MNYNKLDNDYRHKNHCDDGNRDVGKSYCKNMDYDNNKRNKKDSKNYIHNICLVRNEQGGLNTKMN